MVTTMKVEEIARTQLGVSEKTGKNDGIPAQRYMRGDALAWCAGFVLYCLNQSDSIWRHAFEAQHYKCRRVSGFVAVAGENGVFRPRKGYTPKPGDIVFFSNATSDVGVAGNHCGVVDEVVGERVRTIEGNTSNKVARREYAVDDRRILGYASL
jgi:hypothetical protein